MLFSVIVPIYKVESYLGRCIDSILAQTFADFEILLVDDGSPDRCPEICDNYAAKDPRIRVIHKNNGGLVSARKAGILAAQGDYICYVDGDDWVAPGMLAFVHDRLAESPVPLDMVMFGANIVSADGSEAFLHKVPDGYYDRVRLEKEVFPYLLSDRRKGFHPGTVVQGHTWNKVSRRELQLDHYVRDERIRIFTDVPFTYEILLNCQNIYIGSKKLYYYNVDNPQSILALGKKNYLTLSFRYLVLYLRERLRGYGPEIERQLNDFPAILILRTASALSQKGLPLQEAAHSLRDSLNESSMLSLVSLRELPIAPALLLFLLKLRLEVVVIALFDFRRSLKKR